MRQLSEQEVAELNRSSKSNAIDALFNYLDSLPKKYRLKAAELANKALEQDDKNEAIYEKSTSLPEA